MEAVKGGREVGVGAVKGEVSRGKSVSSYIGILRVISMYTVHDHNFLVFSNNTWVLLPGEGVMLRYYRYCDIITAEVNRARRGGGGVVMIY